jgi:hypothetical protein
MKTNPDNKTFIKAVKKLKEGDKLTVDDGVLVVEAIFSEPTHFPFHQRIFEPGMILKKEGSNVRVYIEAEKIGLIKKVVKKGEFVDRQIKDDKVLPADRGIGYKG